MKLSTAELYITNLISNKRSTGEIPGITDIKIKSPSEGDLILGRNLVTFTENLEEVGVPMITVVTEAEHYGGSLELLYKIAYTESMPGGTGVAIDLSVFKKLQKESSIPVILVGGLTADNILSIIQKVHPFAVDVLTRVEERANHKDPP